VRGQEGEQQFGSAVPGVEGAREGGRLVAPADDAQQTRSVGLYELEVLRVELCGAEREHPLDVGGARADPDGERTAAVEQHRVLVLQVVLTEVGALLGHGVVACTAHSLMLPPAASNTFQTGLFMSRFDLMISCLLSNSTRFKTLGNKRMRYTIDINARR